MAQSRPSQRLSLPPQHSSPGASQGVSRVVGASPVHPADQFNPSPGLLTPLGLQGTHNRTFLRPNTGSFATRWREIQGANDWKGLLDPLDECLRLELIRYGQFAQVAYDAFDFDKFSQYCGSCRFSKDNLFKGVDLHDTGYTVTMFIYATADVEVPYLLKKSEREDAWSSKSNWIGYVAVCTDEREIKRLGRRDILIVWRGTVTGLEWAANLKFHLIPCGLTDESKFGVSKNIEVEQGFLSLYTSAKEDSRFNKVSAQSYLVKEIKDLIDKYEGEHELSITICGHSLGSALATLSAYDIAAHDLNQAESVVGGKKTVTQIPITVFSFAGPRVGNLAFKERLEELRVKVLRVVNKKDIVPRVPGWHILEDLLSSAYTHVGVLLKMNDKRSKHLNHDKAALWSLETIFDINHDFSALAMHHNLEVYLHVIDGHGRYDKPPSRDPVLVNKATAFLKDDKFVPEAWWQLKHKGLQYSIRENRYYQIDRAVDDIPVPPKPETVNAARDFTKRLSLRRSFEKHQSLEKSKSPEKGTGPVKSSNPEKIAVPERGTDPVKSTNPEKIAIPERGTGPVKSSNPEKIAVPEKGTDPVKSANPEKVAIPEKGTKL